MKSQRFKIRAYGKKVVSLIVCFSLLLALALGSVFSSSSFNLFHKAFADDMMGGGGQGSSGSPETGDKQGSSGSPETGDEGGGDEGGGDEGGGDEGGGDEGGGDEGGGDGGQGSSGGGPKAVEMGKCDPGFKYDEFGNCAAVTVENPGNAGPSTSAPNSGTSEETTLAATTCPAGQSPMSYGKPGVSDQSSVSRLEDEQQFKTHRGVFYYTSDDNEQHQQESYFHQAELGKAYNPSSFGNCDIKQVENPDGSITATITSTGERIDVIKTDKTRKVVIQENAYSSGQLFYSSAIDDNGVATHLRLDVGFGDPGEIVLLHAIRITEPDGKTTISLIYNAADDSIKVHDLPVGSTVYINNIRDDNDGNPTIATDKNGMKATLKRFNEAYPTAGTSNDDPLASMTSGYRVFHVTNPDSSVKTHMIINPDGTVQPGPKWTAEEIVTTPGGSNHPEESELESEGSDDGGGGDGEE